MKICKNCGSQNPDKSGFCAQCGAKLPHSDVTSDVCPNCGFTGNAPGSHYCSRCGKSLEAGKPRHRLWLIPVILVILIGILAAVAFFQPDQKPTEKTVAIPAVTQPETIQVPADTIPKQEETVSLHLQPSASTKPDVTEETVWMPEEKRPVAVDGGRNYSVVLYNDGTVATIGDDTFGQRSTSGWRNIIQISTFADHTLGLRADGTVVAAGNNRQGQCNVTDWTDIVAIAAGSQHSIGVRSDGTVVAVGTNNAGQCDVEGWQNVVAVAANSGSTFGLTNEGKVLVCGSFYNQSLANWSDIVSISVSTNHVAGVHSDGTVSVVGANDQGQCDDMAKWRDTKQVAVGYGFTAGLREKGSVWVHGTDDEDQHSAMQWTHVVAIGSGTDHILGITEDGKLLAKGANDSGQCDVGPLNRQMGK